MKRLNDAVDRFARSHPRFGIPNLMKVLVIGNIIVMGIEAALVCIQALRLEFYELFGRFYTGRGEAFAPSHIDYSSPAQRAA